MRVTRPHLALLAAAALAPLAAACVVEPSNKIVQCYHDEDCDDGEVCGDDNICYGNPPDLPLGVRIDSPEGVRLPPAEIESLPEWNGKGYFELAWTPKDEPLVEISGRVVLAKDPGQTIAARVVFRRPSRIPGAPDYVVSTSSVAGIEGTEPSFSLELMPTRPGETYEVVIFPSDDGPVPTPAQLAPPYRQQGFSFVDGATSVVFPLGGQNAEGASKTIRGRVRDAADRGVDGLTVRALGRFNPLQAPEVASTLSTTDENGEFVLVVPVSWLDDFDIVMLPPPGADLPEVRLEKVHVDDPIGAVPVEHVLPDVVLPSYPAPLDYELPIKGVAPEGGLEPVLGATVQLATVLAAGPGFSVIYRASGQVDPEGMAQVRLVPGTIAGNRIYLVDVIPLPDAEHAQVWGLEVPVGPAPGVLAGGEPLPARVLLTGAIYDHMGVPTEGVRVRLEPSPRFTYDLRATRMDVANARWPETLTAEDGRFSLWVDPTILDTPASYSLLLEPPADSLLPYWSLDDVGILADDTGSLSLGEIWLPDAAYGRGTVRGPDGAVVPGASVFVYEIIDPILCTNLIDEGECRVPAPLRAFTTADEDGEVRLILPRPPTP